MTDLGLSRLSFPQAFQRLHGVACHADGCAPSPGLERLEALFLQWPHLVLASGTPLEDCRPGLWTVDTAAGLPVFAFLTGETHQVATVVFPAPERDIGLRALWYWHRRRARDFWFCEIDGWRRKDAEATFVRRLYDRTVRRISGDIPGFLAERHWAVREALVKLVLGWHGRSEPREIWDRPDSQDDRALWMQWIEQDNHVLTCFAAQPGRPLRIVHYVPTLAASGVAVRLVVRACAQAQRRHAVEVVTADRLRADPARASANLAACGIAIRRAEGRGLGVRASRDIEWELLRAAPAEVREQGFHLAATLLGNWPDALHCWSHAAHLDGAVAGVATGVPRIVLHLLDERPGDAVGPGRWGLGSWYGILARSRRVQFLADSLGTAASWASSIGISDSAIGVSREAVLPEDLPALIGHRPSAIGDWFNADSPQPTAESGSGRPLRDIVPWQSNRGDVAA
jgi:hypothetical protein